MMTGTTRMIQQSIPILALATLTAFSQVATAVAQPAGNGARIQLFNGPGFAGESREFTSNVPDLGALRPSAGDSAASLIATGVWQVCMDAGYRTRCRDVSGQVSDLGPDRQSISSIRLIRPPTAEELRASQPRPASPTAQTQTPTTPGTQASPPPPAAPPASGARLTLYGQPNYRGAVREFSSNETNLGALRPSAGDFAASAIALGVWEVCMDAGFRTGCRTLQGEVPDLGRDRWSISSIRVVRQPTPEEVRAAPARPGLN